MRATAVHPGGIQTELRRHMTPEAMQALIDRINARQSRRGRTGLQLQDHPARRGDLGLGRRRRAGRRGRRPLLRGLPRGRARADAAEARPASGLRARSRARQGAVGQERGNGRRAVLRKPARLRPPGGPALRCLRTRPLGIARTSDRARWRMRIDRRRPSPIKKFDGHDLLFSLDPLLASTGQAMKGLREPTPDPRTPHCMPSRIRLGSHAPHGTLWEMTGVHRASQPDIRHEHAARSNRGRHPKVPSIRP